MQEIDLSRPLLLMPEHNYQPPLDPADAAAQVAFQYQLRYTAEMIERILTKHPHFTDDCGEYLSAALRLSADLSDRRENGIDGFAQEVDEYIRQDTDGLLSVATDGVSPGFRGYAQSRGLELEVDWE